MDPAHSLSNEKLPDYSLHLPKLVSYPLPVAISSVMLGCLWYFLLKQHPVITGFVAGISLLAGGVYVGLFSLLRRYTNLD